MRLHALDRTTIRTATALLALLTLLGLTTTPTRAAEVDDTATITLVATNDLHRQMAPIDDPGRWSHGLGGAPWLAAHLDAVRDRAPDALQVDAGDLLGSGSTGIELPGAYGDEATVDAMNLMGLDVMAAGNHEFDAGAAELQRLLDGGCWIDDCFYRADEPYHGAQFEALSANVVDTTTGDTVLAPWTIRETDGVAVGFVGAAESSLIPEAGNEHLAFLDVYDSLVTGIEQVRAAGAHVVVLLVHNGSRQHPAGELDMNGCEGVSGPSTWMVPWLDADVIVDGHTHSPYVCDFDGMALMTQATDRGTMYTEITLTYDRGAGEVVERWAENRLVTHDVTPDQDVIDLLDEYRARRGLAPLGWGEQPQSGPDPEDESEADEPVRGNGRGKHETDTDTDNGNGNSKGNGKGNGKKR